MKAFASLLAVLLMLSCTSLAQTASSQQTTPAASPAETTPSPEAAASSGAAHTAALVPGAKLFLEPMGGFEQDLADSFVKKKTPVVVVKTREEADFIVSGSAHVKRPGFFAGMVLSSHGKGNVSIKDARTGNEVFVHPFKKVDQMEADAFIYQHWADQCATHLKKVMEKK